MSHRHTARSAPALLALAALTSLAPAAAHAEGAGQLGVQTVTPFTTLTVDILDPDVETIVFDGVGTITVTDPQGTELGSFFSSEAVSPTPGLGGSYQVELSHYQTDHWDLGVRDAVAEGGRVASTLWDFDTDAWDQDSALTTSFYALVESGDGEHGSVMELEVSGMAGREWSLLANRYGVEGSDAGRSVTQYRQKAQPEYRIYLNAPTMADYQVATAEAWGFGFEPDASACAGIAPGYVGGTFSFETNTVGSYHIVCDVDGNNIYDLSSDRDVARSGPCEPGVNRVKWQGLDNLGEALPAGGYACQLTVTAGEVHFIADDIETAFFGLRTYEVRRDEGRFPATMFWNDYAIQEAAEDMPNGEVGLVSSGSDGIAPGAYDSSVKPNDNAHSWGNYGETGKGDFSFIDTFAWLESDTLAKIDVDIVDTQTDDDHDGIPDACQLDYYRGGCQSTGGAAAGLLLSALALLATARRQRCRA